MAMASSILCGKYSYGFNGKERDYEVNQAGNVNTAPFWEYDSRTAHRWNIDPVTYPWQSGYATFNNNPILFADPLGLFGTKRRAEKFAVKQGWDKSNVFKTLHPMGRGGKWGVVSPWEERIDENRVHHLSGGEPFYSTGSKKGDIENALEDLQDQLYEWSNKTKYGGFGASVKFERGSVAIQGKLDLYATDENQVVPYVDAQVTAEVSGGLKAEKEMGKKTIIKTILNPFGQPLKSSADIYFFDSSNDVPEFGKFSFLGKNQHSKTSTELNGKTPIPSIPILGFKVSAEHVWHQANTVKIGISIGSSKTELKGIVKEKYNILRYTGNPFGKQR